MPIIPEKAESQKGFVTEATRIPAEHRWHKLSKSSDPLLKS